MKIDSIKEEVTHDMEDIDLAAHNQTFKQLRQLNDRNHHMPLNTNTEC
jgi:hypothetical protein